MPVVLDTIDITIEDILLRLAKLMGKIVFNLKHFDLHILFRDKMVEFFVNSCQNKDVEMRRAASFNLPCFFQLYRDFQEDMNLDFKEIYLQFSQE